LFHVLAVYFGLLKYARAHKDNLVLYIKNTAIYWKKMSEASDTEEATFIAILAIFCLIFGTFLMVTSAFLSFISLFLGVIITLAGLIIFLMDNILS